MRTRSLWIPLLGLAIALLASAPAFASTLYGVDFPQSATLYNMNQTTGAATAIGPVGVSEVGDLTSDTRAGSPTLWGVVIGGQDPNVPQDELVRINPATGAATGSVNITLPPISPTGGDPGHMTSIAFDPATGVLYGNTTVGFGAPADALYTINPTTGAASFIGDLGFTNVYALGFDQTGKLFGVDNATDNLISINTGTGAGSLIGPTGLTTVYDIASRPEDDTMFLADSGTNSLYTINTGSGATTLLGDYGPSSINTVGLAFSPVPEPGTLLLLGSGIAGLVLFGRSKGS